MTISIEEFLKRISTSMSDLYLMVCKEFVVYDNNTRIVYIPITTHHNAYLNPMGDFRTHIGHMLLWSQQVEIECNSEELRRALVGAGYEVSPYQLNDKFAIYSMTKPVGMKA